MNYRELGYYRVKAISPKIALGSPRENAKIMLSLVEQESSEAAILLFPELSLTGYTCEDLFFDSGLLNQVKKQIKLVLEKTKDISSILVFGAPYSDSDGRLYNCAFVCHKGKIIGVVPKTHLPNYNEFYEKRWFTEGGNVDKEVNDLEIGQSFRLSAKQLFKLHEMIVGIEICEDLFAPIQPSTNLALASANTILNLSASNELVGKSEYRRDLVKMQSARLNACYIYASASLYESSKDIVFSGHCIIAENGTILIENEKFSLEDSVTSCDIDINKILHERLKNTTFRSSPTPSYIVHNILNNYQLTSLGRAYSKTPFIPEDYFKAKEKGARSDKADDRFKDVLTIQAIGLARRLIATKAKTLVLGLSGGLDSTLAFIVSIEALKKVGLDPSQSLKCITMPGFGTSSRTKASAYALAKAFNIDLKEISIIPAVEQHFKDIDHDPSEITNVYENAQARERTKILFDLANKYDGLVVGTGDLSELAAGFMTTNADQVSSYGVNCSIPKTLVKVLIESYKNNQEECIDLVLSSILNTTISPELIPAKAGKMQSSEDIVGPYVLLDFFLFHFIRNGFSKLKIKELALNTFKNDFNADEINKWLVKFYKRFYLYQFKRTMMPAGVKVGSVSLSPRGDFRLPDEIDYKDLE
jgi:NAD+ synthase (glutamine-hydrolysing)